MMPGSTSGKMAPGGSITRAVSARRSSIQRLELRQRRLLQSQVRVQVDLGGLDRFVPKPQRDDGAVDSRLQEFHGGTVPEDLRRDTLLSEGLASRARNRHVFCQ